MTEEVVISERYVTLLVMQGGGKLEDAAKRHGVDKINKIVRRLIVRGFVNKNQRITAKGQEFILNAPREERRSIYRALRRR